jgi:hypothetical protein
VVGGLIQRDYYWIGTTIGVLRVLLLKGRRHEGRSLASTLRELREGVRFARS